MQRNVRFFGLLLCLSLGGLACDLDGDGDDGDGDDIINMDNNALTCAGYCTSLMANCTGDNTQFVAEEDCMSACGVLPVGARADRTGNTLGCRTFFAETAASGPADACAKAGPGGDNICGSTCLGYCQLAVGFCTGANQVYADMADCMSTCGAVPDDVRFNVGIDSGPHVACFLSHATEATNVPEDHCPGDLAKEAESCK